MLLVACDRAATQSVAFNTAETRLTIVQGKLSIDTLTLPLDRPDTLYCLSWLSLSLVAYYVYVAIIACMYTPSTTPLFV